MAIARDDAEAASVRGLPFVGFVAPPMDAPTLAGEPIAAATVDLTARFISGGSPHRVLPLTASLCTAVAARIPGTLAHAALRPGAGESIRIGMPSGSLTDGADVAQDAAGVWVAHSGACSMGVSMCRCGRVEPASIA